MFLLLMVLASGVGYVVREYQQRSDMPSRPVVPPQPGMAWVLTLTTGYCPCGKCCGKDADGRTAINRDVTRFPYGIAASDKPKMLAYRTWVSVPGYGEAMVDDCGGAMRQSARVGRVHLDLRFKDHDEARRWGRQWHWLELPADSPAAALQQEHNR
ncbi:MAG: 3D domain-containing protein [Planctomycetota bacterium]